MKILIVNGPNLNLLGLREVGLYGTGTYAELTRRLDRAAEVLGVELEQFQSNSEGAIVDKIQSAYDVFDAIIINPAAYTHTSIAILDALKAVALPAAEVHITDIAKREEFRRVSYAGMACEAHFIGLGTDGYLRALEYFAQPKQPDQA